MTGSSASGSMGPTRPAPPPPSPAGIRTSTFPFISQPTTRTAWKLTTTSSSFTSRHLLRPRLPMAEATINGSPGIVSWDYAKLLAFWPGVLFWNHRPTPGPGSVCPALLVTLLKHLFCRKGRIQRRGKTGIDRHLDDHLDHLLTRATNVQRAVNVHLQLRLGVADRGQRRHRGDLPLPQRKYAPRIDVTEGKLDRVPGQVGGDRLERVDHALAGVAVDLL